MDQDSPVTTNGNYLADCHQLSIPASIGTTTYDITYPYNVSTYSVTIFGATGNVGDSVGLVASPNTVVGTVLLLLSIGSLTLSLASIAGLNVGYNLSISDGINTNNLGVITSIDTTLNIVTFSVATTVLFAIGATVYYSIPLIKNCVLSNDKNISLGGSRLGSTGLLTGQIARISYTNSTAAAKTFSFCVELQY